MQFLLVTLLVAGALSAPTPQLSDITTHDGNTRLVPLLVRDSQASPNTLIPVVVPAPTHTQQKIEETAQVIEEETAQVIEEETSQVVADLSDIAHAVETEKKVEEAIKEEISEAAAVEETIDAAVEEIQSSGAPEAVVKSELAEAEEAKATIEETVAGDVQLAAEAEEAALVKIAKDAQHVSVVLEQVTDALVLESELTDSTATSETEVAEPEVVQEVVFVESGAETSVQSANVDAAEKSAIQTEAAGEVIAVEEEPSLIQETVLTEGNSELEGSIVTRVIEVVEEGPVEEVLSITPEEEQQISTVDDTIAEAEAAVAQAEEILSGVVNVPLHKKISESAQHKATSQPRAKSLSSAALVTTADESETIAEEAVTVDAATRSAVEAALADQASDTAAIVIFPQVTAEEETQTDASILLAEDLTSQTEVAVLSVADTPELVIVSETVATTPVEVAADVVTVIDETIPAPAASEVAQISESSVSQTAEVISSSQVAVATIQQLPKQRPTPAQGNLLVNPLTKSAFFSTSSFGSPISAANLILGQPVRVPGRFGFGSGFAPLTQASANLQARNLVDPQFRHFIFDNDSPDVVAAKINFFRVRAATIGAPIAISLGPTPGAASTAAAAGSSTAQEVAPSTIAVEAAPSTIAVEAAPSTIAVEVAPSTIAVEVVPSTIAVEVAPSTIAVEVAPSTTAVEAVESSPAVPSEAA